MKRATATTLTALMLTSGDHHVQFMPIAIEAFGDYRPPIFDYSLVPLIAAFGLKPGVVPHRRGVLGDREPGLQGDGERSAVGG